MLTAAQEAPSDDRSERSRRRRAASGERARSWWRAFGVAFVLSFFAMAAWSYAAPLLSGPDEATHVVKSAGVVRGQFTGTCQDRAPVAPCPSSGPEGPSTEVHVPPFFALLRPDHHVASEARLTMACEAHRPTQPASCIVFPEPSLYLALYLNGGRDAWIYDGRYPPLYYAIVGLPSLLGQGTWVLYLMRLAAAALCSLYVALGVAALWRWSRRRVALLGALVALSPMVFYLGGVVNPSGLEIAAAFATWSTGALLVLGEFEAVPPGLVTSFGVAAATLVLVRALSPLWLVVALVVLGVAAPPARRRLCLASRRLWVAFGFVGIAVGLALSWTVVEHATNVVAATLPPPGTSTARLAAEALSYNAHWIPTMVGIFGSFDTYAPLSTYVIWYVLLVGLGLGALAVGGVREWIALLGLVAGVLVLPAAIVLTHARVDGILWNGRDTLPIEVGVPVLAALVLEARAATSSSAIARRARSVRAVQAGAAPLGALVGVLALVAQLGALGALLRRYSVGTLGPRIAFLWHPIWSPPSGTVTPLLVECVVLAGAYLLAGRRLGAPARAPRAGRSPSGHPPDH